MDRFSFLGSVHIGFIDDLYQKYLKDPDSIEPSWRAFFQGYDFSKEMYGDDPVGTVDQQALEDVRREFLVLDLIQGYRTRGHLFTETNPVRSRRKYEPTLDIENFGLEKDDLDREFQAGTEVGLEGPATLRTIVQHLQNMYCRSIGVEYMYIRKPEVTSWIKQWLHQNENSTIFSKQEKMRILHKLNEAVSFEAFLNTKFVGQKRFSIEGAESLIPALDFAIEYAADQGVEEFVMGMAHRGRLNVLSNIFGKPRKQIFSEFEGKAFVEDEFDGDVKYHLGYSTIKHLKGKDVKLNLSPNPSHLEAVDPVVEGISRAKINNDYEGDRSKVMPILIHGDAAVAAQGVVYEVVQMETLNGYGTGGTLHIVINNQVGFTTNYLDARSSTYCTDIAKVILAPVLHVNGDDPEALVHAIRFATEYRQKFNKDVFIDLLCYRKYGHNEGDEPRFTQPLLYKEISKHPNPREIYSKKLEESNDLDDSALSEMESEFKAMLEEDFDESKKIERNFITPFMDDEWKEFRQSKPEDFHVSPKTGVEEEELKTIAETITTLPSDLKFIKKITRLFKDRHNQVFERNSLDWGMGELMAYGSLIMEGFNVRISGEDVARGTFSHRHAIVKVEDSEQEVCRLNEIPGREGRFAIYNSLLSEYAVLGFDYGYAMASPKTLTVWEAQFGDFANGAQIIIDQFLSAAEDKWKVQNGLVLLLPHGYEGQGAEHSSARLERFLQLCAQYNMQVVNITTPGNFFHALRRQMHRPFRKPLVVMSPKSLLRHPKAVSSLEEMTGGQFEEVIVDSPNEDSKIEKIVFCSGKLYYDLLAERESREDKTTAIVRLEQLYPLPQKQIDEVLNRFSGAKKKIWAQEEPANMGAWTFILWYFPERLELFSPAASASPAAGSSKTALARHREIVESVFNA